MSTPEQIFQETLGKYLKEMMGQAFVIIFLILMALLALGLVEFAIKWNEVR